MISSIRGRRPNIIVLDDIGLEVKPLEDFVFYGGGKGGGGGVQYIPIQTSGSEGTASYTPPPAPPPEEEEATMEMAEESDEDMALRKTATRTGAKSLRIPIGTNNTLGQM